MRRRDLLKASLLAALLRPDAPWAAGRSAPAGAGLSDEAFLNRLTFGATDAERAALGALGREAWLEGQLARGPRDPALDARLAAARLRIAYDAGHDEHGAWEAVDELRPLAALDADPATLLPLVDGENPLDWAERVRPADEVIAASLLRAIHAPAQLREVMTQFWHNHFNVHARKDAGVAAFFPAHDAALREHALGGFRALLGAVATSPAMLAYLDNADSRASPANENWARELLELHTMGVGAYLNDRYPRWDEVPKDAAGLAEGFIDEDVYEVARCFTGWSIGDGRRIGEGEEAPRTGRFAYVEAWHDPYQKRVLGRDMAPQRAPLADGEEVLDLLARHPATARHVCGRIARRLLADDPDPALVERLAAVFLARADAPDQIAEVIRALVADPAFEAPARKVRRPFEFLAALLRASGAEADGTDNGFHWQLARAGWQQHTWAPPDGHPDRAEDWLGAVTLLRLVDFALFAHEGWFGATATGLSGQVPPDLPSHAALVAFWTRRALGPEAEAVPASDLWRLLDADPSDPLPDDEGERRDLSAVLLALAALSPAFLLR